MYLYMYVHVCIKLTRSHEDMLLHEGGVCDTLGNSGFSQVFR